MYLSAMATAILVGSWVFRSEVTAVSLWNVECMMIELGRLFLFLPWRYQVEGRFSTMRLDPARRHLGGILWIPLTLSCLIGKVNKFIQVVNYWRFEVLMNQMLQHVPFFGGESWW